MAGVRRWWRAWWPAITVLVLIAAVVVLCLIGSSASAATSRAAATRHASFGPGRVLLDRGEVQLASPAASGLYVALQRGANGNSLLERLDPQTGTVLARVGLGGSDDGSLEADGSLWVLTTAYTRNAAHFALVRVDPRTLTIRSRVALPGSRLLPGPGEAFALVGGHLWLAYGDRLSEIEPGGGELGPVLRVAKARELEIIPGAGGRTILLSAGDGSGRGWIQERNPVSGAFETTSRNFIGVTQPRLGGVSGQRLWLAESTGMMGYAAAISLRTLRLLPTPAVPREASNQIRTQVADGALFLSDDGGGPARNYCGDPATGAPRVRFSPSMQRGVVLTVADGRIDYLGQPTRKAPYGPLETVEIPRACR